MTQSILETQFGADQIILLVASESAAEIIVWIYSRSWKSKLSGKMIYPTYRDMIEGKPEYMFHLTAQIDGFFSGDEYRTVMYELAKVVAEDIKNVPA